MTTRQRARRAMLVGAAGLVLLSGCTARTAVDVTVRSAASADVVVSAQFTAEAAEVLHGQPEVLDELVAAFTSRTGVEPDVKSSAELVDVRASVDYQHLTQASGITGVGEVRLSAQGESVQAAVELRDAPDLAEAIRAATAGEPDAAAVYSTMLQGTHMVVSVTFPGGLQGDPQLVGLSADVVTTEGGTVTVVRTLADPAPGAIVVTGDPNDPVPWLWIGGAAGAVALAGLATWAARRDQADPLTANRV